ncbi:MULTISPECIES: mechanosensitive ion channel domain-containing protein [unclassified Pseudoalteromonas]|uniref:mechanosensitive ion channel domain-containing protein n=1 Tax=unclassified Pseudoalteromonas TaxID=194690 RepID=UPI000CF6FD9D|nr:MULTISPECIES: mechanosensitive ion channel domain-containing protein [unclassified Pseudoalteromonas]
MSLLELVSQNYKWIITLGVLLLFPLLVRLQQKIFDRAIKGRVDPHRKQRAQLLLKVLLAIVLSCVLLVFWGIELRGLLVLGSSLFAMLGVALFAGWSLLSNLTSFLLMFAQNDYRIGYWVKVIDGANFVEGRIVEMGLMNVVLEHVDGHRVLYPNNLFVTRPVMVLNKAPLKAKPIRKILGPKK